MTSLKWFNYFAYASMAVIFTYFPLYLSDLGLSKTQIGFIMAEGPFISIIANPFWGFMADRYQNGRRMLVMMLIGNLLFMQIVFQVDWFVIIAALMLGFFFFQSPLFSITNSLILTAIENTKLKFGSFRQWGSFGYAFTAFMVGPLLGFIGISHLGLVYTAFIVVTIMIALMLPTNRATNRSAVKLSLRQAFSNRYFILFVILTTLISIPNAVNSMFISLYVQELGGNTTYVGWAIFLAAVFEGPIFLLMDRFLKRKSSFLFGVLVMASSLYLIRWTLMAFAISPMQIIFIQIIHCLTFGIFFYAGTQLTAILTPAEYRASGQAAFTIAWNGVSGIAAGMLGGTLSQQIGFKHVYSLGVIITLIGLISFIVIWQRVRRIERAELSI